MIHHIVLFKFRPETSSGQIDQLTQAIIEMKNKIPSIIKYVWGPSISIENLEKGYTHGFIMTFKSLKDRDDYVPSVLHKEVVKNFVDPICDSGLVFDIEEK